MASLCDTTCGAAATLPTPYDDNCAPLRRRSGASYFILITCDTAIDITNATAVGTAMGVDIEISPKGKLEKGQTEQEVVEDVYGCGGSIIGGLTTPFTFTTYNTAGCASTDDHVYWNTIFAEYQSYRIAWVDCCGWIYYNAADNGTANPGFIFSITQFPDFSPGEADLGIWTFGFEVEHLEPIDAYYDAVNTDLVLAALGISI